MERRFLPSFPSSLSFHLSLVFRLCHSSRENPCLLSFLGDPCLQGDHSPPSSLSVLVDQEYQEDLVGLVHHLYQLWRGRGEGKRKERRADAKPENMDPTDTNTSFSATYMSLGSLMAPVVLVEIVHQAVPSALVFHLPLERQQLPVAHPYRCCQVDQCLLCFRLCHRDQGVPWVPASPLYPSSQAFQESPVSKGRQ